MRDIVDRTMISSVEQTTHAFDVGRLAVQLKSPALEGGQHVHVHLEREELDRELGLVDRGYGTDRDRFMTSQYMERATGASISDGTW